MESSSDSDQEINANMVFMAQIEKVLLDSETSSSSADDKISEVSYYDNTTTYGLFVNDNDDHENFHDCKNFPKNLTESQINHNESVINHNDSEGIDKLIQKFNKKIVKFLKRIEKANQQNKDFKNQNKYLQDKYAVLKNQATTFEMNNKDLNEQLKVLIEKNDDLLAQTIVLKDQLQVKHVVIDTHVECQTNQTVYMIMPSKDTLYNGQKGIGFKTPSYFEKAKDLSPNVYDEKVIGLGYTPMFITHSDEALEIEKFKRARENKIEFASDYGSLNASYVNEKIKFSDDYFKDIINPDFEKIDSPFQQTSSLKPYVPTVILEKIIIDLEDEVIVQICLWIIDSGCSKHMTGNRALLINDIGSVCTLCRPMRNKGCASWDRGKGTWGGRERSFGTIPVLAGVQEGVCRPMRDKEIDTWDGGKGTWGGREKGMGTVWVVAGVQDVSMGEDPYSTATHFGGVTDWHHEPREDSAEAGSLGVIVYGYDGLPMQLAAPPSLGYVPGPEHLPSPDYMPGLEHPPSPVKIPYVPELEYHEYLAPSDDEAPLEDQPLPADASPTAALPGYVADSDLDEDPKEDPEDDHVDYVVDGGDLDDESSDDDDDYDDTEDKDEKTFKDEEEEEHLAPADSSVVPIVDPVLPARDTEALDADEPTPTPRSHHTIILLSQTRLRRARKTVRLEPSMLASMEACIARHDALLSPPLHVPSPPLPLPSPLTTSPTDTGATLGYRAAEIRIRALLPSTSCRTDILEADQAGYGITDTGDEIVKTLMKIALITLEGVDQRVTELGTTVRQRTDEFKIRFEEAQDDQTLMPESTHCSDRSAAISAHVTTLEAQVAALIAQTSSLQTQLTTALGRIEILKARDLKPQEGPAEAGSSCVAAVLAEHDAERSRSRNGNNSNDLGTGGRRQVTTQRECTYTDFLKCRPMSFQGTEGVVKFTSCTMKRSALTWWNSHMRAVRHDVAYAMPWAALKRMITDKYCPRAKVERYISGLSDMIHRSIKASKPQSMQEAIEFATKLMDKKMLTHAERQAEHKRKFDDTLRNNQNQQQPFKRNNVARAYTAGPGHKKPYGGTKPLCPNRFMRSMNTAGALVSPNDMT
nr:hypothetical protein [Tanacetum cinerariifolium]